MLASLCLALLAQAPAPRLGPAVDRVKVDEGTVVAVDGNRMQVSTQAGIVTFDIGSASVIDADGKNHVVTSLYLGEPVRVFYTTDDGAKASEIDVDVPSGR